MTNKEAIEELKKVDTLDMPTRLCEAHYMAIKALEQEPILDKMRTEIEQIADEERKHDEKWAIGLRYAVKIIDKYKAESEERYE